MDRRAHLLSLGILFAAITAWFGSVLFLGRSFFINDLFRYHFGMKSVVRDAMQTLLDGRLPQWHDAFGAGQPLAANPAFELFYPPQWLLLLPDFQTGMTLHIVVHFYLCAAGLYFLLRSLGAGAAAATTGAVAFVLGGPLMSLVRYLPFLFSVAWMPLVFLFARRAFLTGSRRDLCAAGLFGGFQALVGEPTTLVQTWLVVAAYLAYRVVRSNDRAGELKTGAMRLVAAGSVAFAIAAAQLIPAADFARDSARSRPLPWDIVSASSMPPIRPVALFYPSLFQSRVGRDGAPLVRSVYRGGDAFVPSIYISLPIAIAFAAGLLLRLRASRWVLAVLGVAFVIAIGSHTPLLRLLYERGIFTSIRYPEKFFIAALLVAVVWGALMLDRFLSGDERLRTLSLRVAIGWAVVAVLMMVTSYNVVAEWQFWSGVLVRGAVLFAVLYGITRRPQFPWPAIVVALTLVDVLHVHRLLNPTMPRHFFDKPAVAAELPAATNDYRILHWAEWLWANGSQDAESYMADERGRWWSIRNAMFPRSAAAWGYDTILDPDYDLTYLAPTADLVESMRELALTGQTAWQETLLAMSNAWYITRFRPYAAEVSRTGGRVEEMRVVDFVQVPTRLPRFYLADQVVQVAGRADFVQKLTTGRWSPRAAFIVSAPFQPAGGVTRVVRQTAGEIVLDVNASGRALLVLSITPHRYWNATVNGKPAPIMTANIGYQALELGPGRHEVRFEYRNPLLLPSIAISLLAFALTLVVIARSPSVALPAEVPEQLELREQDRFGSRRRSPHPPPAPSPLVAGRRNARSPSPRASGEKVREARMKGRSR